MGLLLPSSFPSLFRHFRSLGCFPIPPYANWPLTTPNGKRFVWESAKKPAGFSSILFTINPLPVSCPFGLFNPVVNGPVKQPTLTLFLSSPTGFGNARRGGPDAPRAASWMCVAVRAGDWYVPATLRRVMF